MPKLIVVTRDGTEHELAAEAGMSVMEIVRDAGIDELQALCGGCLSCATCHVHIDPACFDLLEPANDDEVELLDTSSDRDAFSRLSCQITFEARFDGLRVVVAKED